MEDRRGQGPALRGGGLPLGLLALIASRWGLGAAVVFGLAFGAFQLFGGGAGTAPVSAPVVQSKSSDAQVQFVSFALDDIQATWKQLLPEYENAKLVVFTGSTNTGCGYGDRATGPFYCPTDRNVYVDLEFFRVLEGKLGASGDFAQAYVIAHEIGHHVQNQLGRTTRGSPIAVELQADCFAGVWAHSTSERKLLEAGDLDEAVNATQAIGDDRLQKLQTGTVQPERWTHGSSAQRSAAFRRGLATGDPGSCERAETAEL